MGLLGRRVLWATLQMLWLRPRMKTEIKHDQSPAPSQQMCRLAQARVCRGTQLGLLRIRMVGLLTLQLQPFQLLWLRPWSKAES